MKPLAAVALLVTLAACSAEQPSAGQADQASSGVRATTREDAHAAQPAVVTAPPARSGAPPAGGPRRAADLANAAPQDTASQESAAPPEPATRPADGAASPSKIRGIAVGEPNPSTPRPAGAVPRADGYGALRFGMTAASARKAWPGALHGDPVESGACGFLLPGWSSGSRQLGFMFEQGRFVRYDVGTAGDTAPGGGRVGMTQAQVEALYPGRVTVQPHRYVRGGHTLRIAAASAKGATLVFEADETGKITSWRAGLAPQVDYVEGCS